MSWHLVNPSADDLTFWQFPGSNALHKVSWWPHPNTLRLNPRYRVQHTLPALVPLASKWGLYYREFGEEYDPDDAVNNAVWTGDFEVRGDNHIGVTTGADANGWDIDVNIRGLDDLQFFASPGIAVEVDLQHATEDDIFQYGEWPTGNAGTAFLHNTNTDRHQASPGWVFPDLDPEEFPPILVDFFAVNECYDFPLTPAGMAAFNGIDAKIELDHNIPAYGGPWFFEADLRLRQDDFNACLAPQSQNSILGIVNEEAAYSARRLELPDYPGFNEWFKFRFEFEWSSGLQLRYECWIDDVLQDSLTGNRVNLGYDNLGVRRLAGPAVWGDFDMKNLIYKRGTFASPVVFLDMPLIENALDLGPDENHGTTFNMPLPSV